MMDNHIKFIAQSNKKVKWFKYGDVTYWSLNFISSGIACIIWINNNGKKKFSDSYRSLWINGGSQMKTNCRSKYITYVSTDEDLKWSSPSKKSVLE